MTGHDRQWLLNRRNFDGRWCGTSHWYLRGAEGDGRGEDGGDGDGDGAEGHLDLERPARTIADTCYDIRFSDDDTGVWDGSGLLMAPGGRRTLALTRADYNRGGQCWQFDAVAGQSSLAVEAAEPRFGHEVNLFRDRSRSMLVLLYKPLRRDGRTRWRLDAVGAVPFRCSRSTPADPARPAAPDWRSLLAEQEGWPGTLETLVPGAWPAEVPPPQRCEPFRSSDFARHRLSAGFADGLVCSLPEQLPEGGFRLEVGCRLGPDRFHQVSLPYDDAQRLIRWEVRRFQRP